MRVRVKVEGLRELQRTLQQMERKLAIKALKQGLRKAAKPVLLKARENAGAIADSGATKAALRLLVRAGRKNKHTATAYIAPNAKAKRALNYYNRERAKDGKEPVDRMRHFHLAEWGRTYKGSTQPGRRWLTRAFDATASTVPFLFAVQLRRAIEEFKQ